MLHKKITLYSFFGLFLVFMLNQSCTYEKAAPKSEVCDTLGQIGYETNIRSIMAQNCIGCHSGSSPSSGVWLNSKETVQQAAEDYLLFHVINHTSGYSQMPKNGSKLSKCQIQIIKKWIDTGKK